MKEKILKNTILSCLLIFLLLLAVHAFEAIVLRMDETVFAENFINKVFGIIVIAVILKILDWKWSDIGFTAEGLGKGIFRGAALAAVSFFVAYSDDGESLYRHDRSLLQQLHCYQSGAHHHRYRN